MRNDVREQEQNYCGPQLRPSQALKANACYTDDIPAAHQRILAQREPKARHFDQFSYGG